MGHQSRPEQERKVHFIGLNARGKALLQRGIRRCREVGVRIWLDSGMEERFEREVEVPPEKLPGRPLLSDDMPGMEQMLFSYGFPDGSVYVEDMQSSQLACQPHQDVDTLVTLHFLQFTALKRDGQWVEETRWTKAEIVRELSRFC